MQKIKLYKTLCAFLVVFATVACSDDDSFSLSPSNRLTFSHDTIAMDTVFSRVPTAKKTFWIYNRSGDGIRCTNARLERGNQSGFRVNVDGEYLGQAQGYQISDIEIRKNDSICVFVELTSPSNYQEEPQKIEDNLVFLLESGVEQKVNLNAWSWDADMMTDVIVSKDSTIATSRPTIIYGGITVKEGATLTVGEGTTLYFHDKAGIDVYGKLICEGTAQNNVTLRGDRIDRMFDYLPYDGVSGQWRGIHFYEPSYENNINYTDIHGACDAIVCDSSDVSRLKLSLHNSIVHNSQGYGIKSIHSVIDVENTQITNTLSDCVGIFGGVAMLNHCTIAQFYPFDSQRGAALRFTNFYEDGNLPLYSFDCINTIVTGYADDVIMGEMRDSTIAYSYTFDHCLLRTPEMEPDEKRLIGNVWEDVEDTTATGDKNFANIDTELLQYNFQLSAVSKAIGAANKEKALEYDRLGVKRDDDPDIGCYEASLANKISKRRNTKRQLY